MWGPWTFSALEMYSNIFWNLQQQLLGFCQQCQQAQQLQSSMWNCQVCAPRRKQKEIHICSIFDDIWLLRCRDTHIFLGSKVWFVPCLNSDEEIIVHILILDKWIKTGQHRDECKKQWHNIVKWSIDNLSSTTNQTFTTTYCHNWIPFKHNEKKKEKIY